MHKPRVTITLGRSGQVVERGGSVSDNERPRADTMAVTRNKRFRGEGIGRSVDGLSINKRQRGDGMNRSWQDNGVHGLQFSQSDLRLKLIHKRLIRRAIEHKMDRRKKLSKTIRPSVRRNVLQQWSEPAGSLSCTMPPKERYSFRVSRGLSPPRNFDELCQVPPARAANASRAGWLLSNDGTYRPMGSTHLMLRGPPETSKPVKQLTSMRNMRQRSSYVIEEAPSVAGLLQSLNLGKYNVNFQVEEVDMAALKQMGDNDLKDMGIPMGPRKKILARLPRPRQRQP